MTAEELKQGVGGERLVQDYGDVLAALDSLVLRDLIGCFPTAKIEHMKSAVSGRTPLNLVRAIELELEVRADSTREWAKVAKVMGQSDGPK
jgi:hypothetical protein